MVDGTVGGGAVAAWFNDGEREVHVAELGPDAAGFTNTAEVAATRASYSYNRPVVDVGADGGRRRRVLGCRSWRHAPPMALVRPAGGAFGAPEPIGPPQPVDRVDVTDVAVGPGGRDRRGLSVTDQVEVAIRDAGGTWGNARGARHRRRRWPFIGPNPHVGSTRR